MECVEEDWLSGREEGGGDGWDTPATCYLSREHACRVDAWGRVGCARGWGRQQGSPRLVHPPAELSSTTGPQGQGEGRGSSLSIHSLPSGPSSPFPTEEQPVASWALSFERLLQDPLGLAYFTVSLGWGKGRGDTGKGRVWMELQAGQSGVLCQLPHLAFLSTLFLFSQMGTFLPSPCPCLCLSFSLPAFRSGSICLAGLLRLAWSLGPVPVPVSLITSPSLVSVSLSLCLPPLPGVPEEGVQRGKRDFLEGLRALPTDPGQRYPAGGRGGSWGRGLGRGEMGHAP